MPIHRADRLFPIADQSGQQENRSEFERDHDRILYSSAFRRLAGVTQVVNATEGQIFHTRLTHSLKVAQIGKRISQRIIKSSQKDKALRKAIDYWGGLDPDVVEAAALAHDLGNPPFGHIAEDALNELICQNCEDSDGFEGNAQSFRIVNRLALGYKDFSGLNLTRATLNAILKYPWNKKGIPEVKNSGSTVEDEGSSSATNDEEAPKKGHKFGVYIEDIKAFEFAREMCPDLDINKTPTLEAAIMDCSDDISYAVHDFEDFYRANIIPIENIKNIYYRKELLDKITESDERWFPKNPNANVEDVIYDFNQTFIEGGPLRSPFLGGGRERIAIRSWCSALIKRFVQNITVTTTLDSHLYPIQLPYDIAVDLIILKYITKYYVIEKPVLKRQQFGECQIIKNLFTLFLSICMEEDGKKFDNWAKILPAYCREEITKIRREKSLTKKNASRIVADTISYLSDDEAIKLYSRISGGNPGSIFDLLTT